MEKISCSQSLSDLTIDLWCNRIPDYYQYTPALLPIQGKDVVKSESVIKEENRLLPVETANTNYDAETDVDLDNLLHHAETLVRKVKDELNTGTETPTQPGPLSNKRKGLSAEASLTTSPKKKMHIAIACGNNACFD